MGSVACFHDPQSGAYHADAVSNQTQPSDSGHVVQPLEVHVLFLYLPEELIECLLLVYRKVELPRFILHDDFVEFIELIA